MPPGMFDNTADSDYMSAMLMSWYMSGYYTGLYHGQKQARDEIQSQPSSSVHEAATTSSEKGAPSKNKKIRRSRH